MTKFKLVSVLPALCASWMLTGCPDDTTEGNDDNNDSSSDESNSDPDTTVSGVTLSTTDSDPSSSSDDTIEPTMTTMDPDSSSSGDPTNGTESSSSSADGTGSSGSESGSESSSSGDATEGTTDTGEMNTEPYGDCEQGKEAPITCLDGEICIGFADGALACGLEGCVDEGDCAEPTSGTAIPACLGLNGGGSACALDCTEGQDCPTGMSCIDLGPGLSACAWPPVAPGGGECPDDTLGAAPLSYDGDNTGLFDDHIASCGDGGGVEAQLEFTADADGGYTFDTFGSAGDTILFALDGCGGAELACNDDSGSGQSSITLNLTDGQTVIIGVDGYGGEVGAYTLNVEFVGDLLDGGSCCDEQVAPGCDVAEVEACVCALDDFCCGLDKAGEGVWDSFCVDSAVADCGAFCD